MIEDPDLSELVELGPNLRLLDEVNALAREKGCMPSQLALAWVLAQGGDIVPIPGTKHRKYLEENAAAAAMRLTAAELARLDRALPAGAATGMRYSAQGMQSVNR